MHTLFISDLHLCPEQVQLQRAFQEFMQGPARQAQALYVLGDLFEYWIGDDDLDDAFHHSIVRTFAQLASQGTALFIMPGNRDFLLGSRFAQACGAQLLNDPTIITLGQHPSLLMHGDSLCTDDSNYQAFRQQSRSQAWQSAFLSQPLEKRRAIAQQYRSMSEQAKQEKNAALMDVNIQAAQGSLHEQGCRFLIHGHTHRPAQHLLGDGQEQRWVIPDWRDQAVWLAWDGHMLSFQALPCRA